MRTHEKVLPTL